MNPFHFSIKACKRGAAKNHVSYITRKGCHSVRDDLIVTEHGNMPAWVNDDPMELWDIAEKYGRKNGYPFHSYTISLPNALTIEQNVDLARELVHALAGKKPFQLAVHAPISSLEGKLNPHVHAVISNIIPDGIDRPPEQMFRRYNPMHPERGGCRKDRRGEKLSEVKKHLIAERKTVADLTNATLKKYGHANRVDHRTLEQQGKTREPERYLGPARIRTMSAEDKRQFVAARRGDLQVTA